ncbi:MAG: transposase [Pseudomonadota bacterium]|nr:transposase [Pseudomonadota bacterium]
MPLACRIAQFCAVPVEYRRPVTLINDRKAETLADGLHDHPSVTVISRDRMKAYIDAARAGAPGATQVADRFHLVQKSRRSA